MHALALFAVLVFAAPEPELAFPKSMAADAIAVSPDGKLLAGRLGGEHGLVLWDAETGRERKWIATEGAPGERIAFSADGKRIAATFSAGGFRVYDVATGALLSKVELKGFDTPYALSFSKDAKTLAVQHTNKVRLLDMSAMEGKAIREEDFKPASVRWAGFTSGSDEPLVVLRDDATKVHRFVRLPRSGAPKPFGKEVANPGNLIAVSADGKRLLGVDSSIIGGTIAAWEIATATKIASTALKGEASDAVLSADGSIAVVRHNESSGSNAKTGGLIAWTVGAGAEPIRAPDPNPGFNGPKNGRSPVLASDGTIYALTHPGIERWKKSSKGGVTAWTAAPALRGATRWYPQVLAVGSGTILFAAKEAGKPVVEWTIATGEMRETRLQPASSTVIWSADGKTAFARAKGAYLDVFDAVTGARGKTLGDPESAYRGESIIAESAAADGKRVAMLLEKTTTSGSGKYATRTKSFRIQVWDVASGTATLDLPLDASVKDAPVMVLSPDGTRLVLADGSQARVWDLAAAPPKELPAIRDADGIAKVAFGSDSAVLFVAGAKNAKAIDLATGAALRTFAGDAPVSTLTATPDGKVLTTGDKGTLRVFDAATAAEEAAITDDTFKYSRAWRAPDGSFFATSSANKLFGPKGDLLATLTFFDGGGWVAVAPDGRVDGTEAALKQLYWRVGDKAEPIEAHLAKKQKKGLLSGK